MNSSTKSRIMPASPVQTEGSSFFPSLLQFIKISNKRDSRSKKTVAEILHTLRDDDRCGIKIGLNWWFGLPVYIDFQKVFIWII